MGHWTAFLLASLVLAVTPGPGVLYIVTRTLAQGRVAGLASVLGVALGNLGNALAAALGLAALFSVSALAFDLVKYAGAAYLCWLGWRSLRAAPSTAGTTAVTAPAAAVEPVAPRRLLRDGFLVALLNPKTTLFFAAFLPQFVAPGSSPVVQSVLLGAAFVLVAASTDLGYVLVASRAAPWLARSAQRGGTAAAGRWLSAGIYLGLGAYTAVLGARPRA